MKQILVTLCLACILPCTGFSHIVQKKLQSIPQEDYIILEEFFSYMICHEFFGYVLYGDKPMAAGGFDTHFTIENILGDSAAKHRWLRFSWETWEKYASLFPSEKFILRLSKNPISPSFYWIILINKNSCLTCIKSNLDIFKSVLGDSITPESILYDLSIKEDIFKDVLGEHHGILGILFGYGRQNAMNFHNQRKEFEVSKFIYQENTKTKTPRNKLSPFNSYTHDLFVIDFPRFAEVKDEQESIQLRASYEKTWNKLFRLYSPGEFLKTSIKKLVR